MRLHLVVPGLLWPSKALYDTVFDLELPTLSWLLSRGETAWQEPQPFETWLCHALGIAAADPPFAALRLLGEVGLPHPGDDVWLCADPARLVIEQQRLILAGGKVPVDDERMRSIAHTTNALLSETILGSEFFPASNDRGYLRLQHVPQIVTTPPSAVVGHTVEHDLPRGAQAREWRRLSNELSMRLTTLTGADRHDMPESGGINTLWFWGAGSLPARKAVSSSSYQVVLADDALSRGLADWAGIPCLPVPAGCHALPPHENALVVIDRLQQSAQELDAAAWRAALAMFEHDWLQPARTLLARGRLRRLRISALGPEHILDAVLTRGHHLKFWRRPKPLHRSLAPTA